ncbi:MAG: F0F1 ATP synthase subunit delta [Acidimicrobiales bacterium]
MRQSIRGFADAIFETAAEQGLVPQVAAELDTVRATLAGSEDLSQALIDPGLLPAVRWGVVDDLWSGRLSGPTVGLLRYLIDADAATEFATDLDWLCGRADALAAGQRPTGAVVLGRSAAAERIDGYATAVLGDLEGEESLGDVEDELFRFMRLVDGTPELREALTSNDVAPQARQALVRDLLSARATLTTVRLGSYATLVGRPREYINDLGALVERVAAESNRRVAEVRSAVELEEADLQRLAEALGRVTGRDVQVRVTLDPSVIAGFVALIGNTEIDASARHRLQLLKDRLILPEATVTANTTTPGEPS